MIKLAAYLDGFSSRKDGSASIRFSTQEIPANEFAELSRNLNAFGFLLFKENEIDISDIPNEDADDNDVKHSKRLRNVIFILWKQRGEKGDFEVFYRSTMEKFINKVKAELE